jgi:hypothetical protein
MRAKRAADPESFRLRRLAERARMTPEQKAERAAWMREYRKRRPAVRELERDRFLKKKYGITSVDYDALLERQSGRCAVCGEKGGAPLTGDDARARSRVLHVDHEHGTGRVRGLLCRLCNIALGHAGDDPARLRAMADYLEMP